MMTTGSGELVVQIGETKLVVDCKVKPVALAGQVRITLWPDGVNVSDDGTTGNEMRNTVPLPPMPPAPAVPYRAFPAKVNPPAGLAPSLLVAKKEAPVSAVKL